MAKTIKLILTGDAQLDRNLKEFATNAQRRIVKKATRESLRPVLADAKANAPKASGLLRKNIKLRAIKRSRVRIGNQVTVGFQFHEFYGGFQEWGWRVGKRTAEQVRAQQFLKRAATKAKKLGRKRSSELLKRYKAVQAAKDPRRMIEGKLFMTNAMNNNKQQAQSIFRSVAAAEIEAEAKKLPKGK